MLKPPVPVLGRLETENPAEGVEEVLLRKIVVVDVSVVRCPVPVGATKLVVEELVNQGTPAEIGLPSVEAAVPVESGEVMVV